MKIWGSSAPNLSRKKYPGMIGRTSIGPYHRKRKKTRILNFRNQNKAFHGSHNSGAPDQEPFADAVYRAYILSQVYLKDSMRSLMASEAVKLPTDIASSSGKPLKREA